MFSSAALTERNVVLSSKKKLDSEPVLAKQKWYLRHKNDRLDSEYNRLVYIATTHPSLQGFIDGTRTEKRRTYLASGIRM